MKELNKILLFLVFVLVYSSIIYLVGQKQESEIEVSISNAFLIDMISQRYPDGTYKSEWKPVVEDYHAYLKKVPFCTDRNWTDVCTYPPIAFSNQSLNGTTYIKAKLPINIVDIVFLWMGK